MSKKNEHPVSGGSQTSASTGSAVHVASLDLRRKLAQMAIAEASSPLQGAVEGDIDVDEGRPFRKGAPSRGETYQAILARRGLKEVEARLESKPGEEQQKYSMHSFGAQFAEVQVDPDLGQVRVTRFTGAFGAGRILNAKTARSRLIGGSVWGISMALHEHTVMDPRYGRYVNNDLAEYHIPVNADIPDIDAVWVDEQDPYVNPLGVKGIGEIGITGAAAAVANAVYHATGKRVRDLPITLDKLL